jgi:hypothetical protein
MIQIRALKIRKPPYVLAGRHPDVCRMMLP